MCHSNVITQVWQHTHIILLRHLNNPHGIYYIDNMHIIFFSMMHNKFVTTHTITYTQHEVRHAVVYPPFETKTTHIPFPNHLIELMLIVWRKCKEPWNMGDRLTAYRWRGMSCDIGIVYTNRTITTVHLIYRCRCSGIIFPWNTLVSKLIIWTSSKVVYINVHVDNHPPPPLCIIRSTYLNWHPVN